MKHWGVCRTAYHWRSVLVFGAALAWCHSSWAGPPQVTGSSKKVESTLRGDAPRTGTTEAPDDSRRGARADLKRARALVNDNALDQALPIYEALMLQEPRAPWLALEVGAALASAGRFVEATPHLERAHKLDTLSVEAAHQLALCLDARGQQPRALALYRRVLMLEPEHVSARFNLGRLYYELGALGDAESAYRDLVARQPKHWMALNNLGLVLLDRDRPAAALPFLQRALRLRPEAPGVLHNIGRAQAARGESARALVYFERALKLWGEDDVASVRLHFDRGNALFALNRWEEAAQAYRRALSLDPAYAPARLNLGAALVNLGDNEGAVVALELAVDYEAERVAIYQLIASDYLSRDEHEAALTQLRRARKLDARNPQTYLLLGRALDASGQPAASRAALDTACQLGASEACRD